MSRYFSSNLRGRRESLGSLGAGNVGAVLGWSSDVSGFSWTGSDSQAVLELSQGEGWAERSAKVADKLSRAAGRQEGQGGGRHWDQAHREPP